MLKLFYKITLLFVLIVSATVLYQKNTYAYHTLVHIDPIPQTKVLIENEKYVDAYEYLNYFMAFDYINKDPQSQALLQSIIEKRNSLSYQSEKLAEGIYTGSSDKLLGQASAIGSDFFLIGDIRDLVLEGSHYYHDEEVDQVLVALSTVGLVASVSTFVTLGSSAVAKSAVSMLKLARKSKALPVWLSTYLTKEAKVIRKSKDISSLKPLFTDLENLRTTLGLRQTLKLVSKTGSYKELQAFSKLSKRYGNKTLPLLKLSEKKVLTEATTLKKMDIKTIEVASTYGISGFIHLIKGGEKNFIKTTKRMKAYSKVGYKGEVWKVFLWLMKHLSDTMLLLIMGISSLLLLPLKKIIHFKSLTKGHF